MAELSYRKVDFKKKNTLDEAPAESFSFEGELIVQDFVDALGLFIDGIIIERDGEFHHTSAREAVAKHQYYFSVDPNVDSLYSLLARFDGQTGVVFTELEKLPERKAINKE